LLQKKYPGRFDVSKAISLLGNDMTVQQLQAGTPPEQIIASWAADLQAFDQMRRMYFLYK
jgi:uncharacterized protein YbbC (DUF1343 family)